MVENAKQLRAGRIVGPALMSRRVKPAKFVRKSVILIVTLLAAAMLLFPVYWILKDAVETNAQIYHSPPYILPPSLSLQGLSSVLPFVAPSLWHSAIIAVGCVLVVILVATPSGFALAQFNLIGGSGITLILLISLMFPSVMFVLPLYLTFYHAGLLNTYWALILADSTYTVPLAILIMYTYMRSLPMSLVEAALMDGASTVDTFVRIVVPLSAPAIATSGIFAFLSGWGDYLFALTFTSGSSMTPASISVFSYIVPGKITEWNQVMSAALLLLLPVIVVMIFGQRFIRTGISAGALRE